jgi:hypothetical protein
MASNLASMSVVRKSNKVETDDSDEKALGSYCPDHALDSLETDRRSQAEVE